MKYRNFPMVSKVVFGRGSFNQLEEVLEPKRLNTEAPFIYIIDDVFKGNAWLTSRIPLAYADKIIYISTVEEPKTSLIDELVNDIVLSHSILPSGIIGIGGGSALDVAKAVSILLTNTGKSEDIVKKISTGKINKFKQDNSLLSQPWVMEPKKSVQDIVKELSITNLKIKDFYRLKIGE